MDDAITEFARTNKNLTDFWTLFTDKDTPDVSKLTVLIINAPCMGFGDVVFAMKFADLLREWYGCTVMIATPQTKGFISLGEKPGNLYDLVSSSKNTQCRRLAKLHVTQNGHEIEAPKADLLFVAPLQADFDPDLRDIQKLFPYANRFNTFFLSEYNDTLRKKVDFHTGIGKGRYGLLFTDPVPGSKPVSLKNKYCVVYVANSLPRVKNCVYSFLEMVAHKYRDDNFDIVMPSWVLDREFKMGKNMVQILRKHFGTVSIVTPKETTTTEGQGVHNVSIRLDILPLPNKIMMDLITFSVDDILLTGDQSITDALSCCVNKNIFYQIAPWKENFAKHLVKEMPNKWLAKKTLSCGSLKAISYRSDNTNFKKKWDFRLLARSKMNGIFNYTAIKKYGSLTDKEILRRFETLAIHSRSNGSFLRKWTNTPTFSQR